jgi:hypothetical protein
MTTTLNASTAGAGGFIATSDNSGSLALQTAGTTAVTIDTSQNVGIGTASPQSKLMSQPTGAFTAAGTNSNAGLHLTSSTTTGGLAGQSIVWSNYGTSGSAVQAYISAATYGSNFMTFSGNGTSESMRIDSSGNLLVGGTSIRDGAKVSIDTSGNGLAIYVIPNTSAVDFAIFRANSGTLCGAISRVGTTGAVTYTSTSDYRLKENITPMTGALNKIARLKPVTYTWKNGGQSAEGFIAHELAEVCPDAVVGAKDQLDADGNPKYQGIDTSFLVATLTAALQELKAINDTQAETINALTARIVAIESKA